MGDSTIHPYSCLFTHKDANRKFVTSKLIKSKALMGQYEMQKPLEPLVIGSEHQFKTRADVGWYRLRAHEYGARKVWVAPRKRETNLGNDD